MRPSDENLQHLTDLILSLGFLQTDVTTSHHEFQEPTVPDMSDRNTFFSKGGTTVKINEVFISSGSDEDPLTRVAIILYVTEVPLHRIGRHGKVWMELFEVDQIVDYFRPEIRGMRIDKILG